ncbi:MAG: hypothetical protein R2856_08340 [Caldilineaceae bacterium]
MGESGSKSTLLRMLNLQEAPDATSTRLRATSSTSPATRASTCWNWTATPSAKR